MDDQEPTAYSRIAAMIARLADGGDRTDLAALGRREGLSPFYLQRTFRRWVGLSPRQFVGFARVCHAKGLLRAAGSVLDVALDVGLSGPGRLHDHFVSLEAMTPGEYKRGGSGLAIRHGLGPTPLGRAIVAWTGRGV